MREDKRGIGLSNRYCEICGTEYKPKMALQMTCSSACSQRMRSKKQAKEQLRQRQAARAAKTAEGMYKIADTLPYDLDMLGISMNATEMDEALEDCCLPACARIVRGDLHYEVFTHTAGNGRQFQRLLAEDGKIIMCKAEKRICV